MNWFPHNKFPEILFRELKVFKDDRGSFTVPWVWGEAPMQSVQDNVSVSKKNVFRGMHYQRGPKAQGKLVTVLQGSVIDFFVDLRKASSTFGQWGWMPLGDKFQYSDKKLQLYVPVGFAHGFLSLEDDTIFSYKVSAPYDPETEVSLRPDQLENLTTFLKDGEYPSLEEMIISEKDLEGNTMLELSEKCLLF